MARSHNIEAKGIKRGVHYVPLGICDSPPVIEMVQEEERVTFRVSPRYQNLRGDLNSGKIRKRLALRRFDFW